MTAGETILRDALDFMRDNDRRDVPVTAPEAELLAVLVLVLGELPGWVHGSFDQNDPECPMAIANATIRKTLDGVYPYPSQPFG